MRKAAFAFLFAVVQTAAAETTVVRLDRDQLRAVANELGRTVDAAFQERSDVAIARLEPGELEQLTAAGFDLQVDIDATRALAEQPTAVRGAGIPGFSCYRTVDETYADLGALAAANPEIAQWFDIGDSWEKINGPAPGNDVMALTLAQGDPTGRPPFVLVAAMHARELTTAEIATRFAENLITGYGVDADLTWILDHYVVHIVPQYNPDGREDVEDGNIWQRKNTNIDWCPSSNYGVDLNRNAAFMFGGAGSSGSACTDNFRGPSAASEPETTVIETAIDDWFVDQRGSGLSDPAPADTEGVFVSLHSFGELILYPWEFNVSMSAPNEPELETLGRKFGYFTDYVACQSCLSSAAGTIVDQAYGEYGVAAFTFEVGTTFHQACSTFENTIVDDVIDALVYAAKAARRPYQNPAGPDVHDIQVGPQNNDMIPLTAIADDTRYNGSEPSQPIAAVSYTVNEPPWLTAGTGMFALDGMFNATVEAATASIPIAGLPIGRHLVYVVATDAAGNTGVPTAAWLDVTDQIFSSSFD